MGTKILSIGEIIWDVYPDKKTIGGAPLNFAAHVVQCGAESTLISAIGNDDLGKEAIKTLSEFGVDCRYIKTTNQPTGQCIVSLDGNGIPHYNVLKDVSYDQIIMDETEYLQLNCENYDALYFGTLIQRNEVSKKTVHELVRNCKFKSIICDVNLRPDCYDFDSINFCLTHATILKVSMEEEPILRSFGGYRPQNESPASVTKAICEKYPQLEIVIVTLGKEGSYAYDLKNDVEYTQCSIGEQVVSTVGAGDSFTAAWLTSYLNKLPIDMCMKKAAEVSGFVVAHTEAIPKY